MIKHHNELRQRGTKQGFILIELIVVVAIIAVLAAIVTATVSKYVPKAKEAAINKLLDVMYADSIKYYIDHGNYDNWFVSKEFYKVLIPLSTHGGYNFYALDDVPSNHQNWCFAENLVENGVSPPTEFYGPSICIDATGYRKTTDYDVERCRTGLCSDSY